MQVVDYNSFRSGAGRRVVTPMLRNDRFSRLVVSFIGLVGPSMNLRRLRIA